jgi:hypothetical protein
MQFTEHIPGHVYDQLLRGLEEYAGGRNRCGRAARTSAHPCRHAARRRHGGTRRRASRLQPRERSAGTSRRPCRLSSLIAIRLGRRLPPVSVTRRQYLTMPGEAGNTCFRASCSASRYRLPQPSWNVGSVGVQTCLARGARAGHSNRGYDAHSLVPRHTLAWRHKI